MSDNNDAVKTAFTKENLYALEQAIVGGELTVKYTDKEITYRSLSDLWKLRELMMKALGLVPKPLSPGLFGGTRIKATFDKGLTGKKCGKEVWPGEDEENH